MMATFMTRIMMPSAASAAFMISSMAVISSLRTARYPASMVCVPVVCTVGVIVCSVVHMRACFRAFCYAAYVVAVFTNLCAAVKTPYFIY